MEFCAEMMVHVGGIKELDNPGVMLFPKVLVCLDCGFAQFQVPRIELALLAATPPSERFKMAAAG
jgi:hypothetical protein